MKFLLIIISITFLHSCEKSSVDKKVDEDKAHAEEMVKEIKQKTIRDREKRKTAKEKENADFEAKKKSRYNLK